MATVSTAAAQTAASWITELDDMDSDYILSPLEYSLMLQNLTSCLSRRHLPALAHISPTLRALVERRLYRDIEIPYNPQAGPAAEEEEGHGMKLWPLYETLSRRPDLTRKMHIMSLIIQKRDLNVEVPSTGVLPGGMAFASHLNMAMPEPTIAGALFQLPLGIKELSLHAYQDY
jgi:hypothetical protein